MIPSPISLSLLLPSSPLDPNTDAELPGKSKHLHVTCLHSPWAGLLAVPGAPRTCSDFAKAEASNSVSITSVNLEMCAEHPGKSFPSRIIETNSQNNLCTTELGREAIFVLNTDPRPIHSVSTTSVNPETCAEHPESSPGTNFVLTADPRPLYSISTTPFNLQTHTEPLELCSGFPRTSLTSNTDPCSLNPVSTLSVSPETCAECSESYSGTHFTSKVHSCQPSSILTTPWNTEVRVESTETEEPSATILFASVAGPITPQPANRLRLSLLTRIRKIRDIENDVQVYHEDNALIQSVKRPRIEIGNDELVYQSLTPSHLRNNVANSCEENRFPLPSRQPHLLKKLEDTHFKIKDEDPDLDSLEILQEPKSDESSI